MLVESKDLELVASDGNRFAAFAALPAEPNGIGVLVMPDVRGLFPEYEEIATSLAADGMAVVTIDWFGRTAGAEKRSGDFDFMNHTLHTTAEQVQLDVSAALAYLRSPDGGACAEIFTLGFSFGGRHSILATAEPHGLSGAIGFYFMPGAKDRPPFMESSGRPGPTQRAGELTAPVLGVWASEDTELGILPEDVKAFDEALDAAGLDHEVITFAGVPHSFLDRGFQDYAETRAAAWERVRAFIRRHASRPIPA
jgi:carboxymethylenebutenolidase